MRILNPHARIIETSDHRAMPWKNGLGLTREIVAVSRNREEGFDWRLSIADITADAAFSRFSGYARTIALLEGNGMELTCDGISHDLSKAFTPFDFDGGAATQSRLLGGPVRDFNIMSARKRCRHEWQVLRRFPFVLRTQSSTCYALFCFSGSLSLQTAHAAPVALAAEETLLIEPAAMTITVDAITDDSCALLISFNPR